MKKTNNQTKLQLWQPVSTFYLGAGEIAQAIQPLNKQQLLQGTSEREHQVPEVVAVYTPPLAGSCTDLLRVVIFQAYYR